MSIQDIFKIFESKQKYQDPFILKNEEMHFGVLNIKINDSRSLIETIEAYCEYKVKQRICMKNLNGKKIVLGTEQCNDVLNLFENYRPEHEKFLSLSVKACRKLQEKNGFPKYAFIRDKYEPETGRSYIFFNWYNPAFGNTIEADGDILIFLLINSEKEVKEKVLSKENYPSLLNGDEIYKKVLEETLHDLSLSLENSETYDTGPYSDFNFRPFSNFFS